MTVSIYAYKTLKVPTRWGMNTIMLDYEDDISFLKKKHRDEISVGAKA
jgi:hypothetical protein